MSSDNKKQEKTRLHQRNVNREPYDLDALVMCTPQLKDYVKPNRMGHPSVDFSNPVAVKLLNRALLDHYYGISYWNFPDTNLCPPIPGRADYIHYLADLLAETNFGRIPTGNAITGIDIGVGANCIYPLIGVSSYEWNFIGTDIDAASIASAQSIVDSNPSIQSKVELRLQSNVKDVFFNTLRRDEEVDFAMCNPPFHASMEDALKGTQRKVKNLTGKQTEKPELNFAGVSNELVYEGGELKFISNMVRESKKYAENCYLFSTLVSKQSNLKTIEKLLATLEAKQVKVIPMGTGNKTSRIISWTFLSPDAQKNWRLRRWKSDK